MKKCLALILIFILCVGCGMKIEKIVEKEMVYSASFSTVWITVTSILIDYNLPISDYETGKDSISINCEIAHAPQEWLDAPEKDIDYRLNECRGTCNIFIYEIGEGCNVLVTSSYSALVWPYTPGAIEEYRSFPSSGMFEDLFHSLLAERLN